MAAIAAVLVGPLILVCLDRKTWRKQIAILALIHSALSLASFVAAFAHTGFLTASVGAPAFNCGNLKCEEGGVPCSAYALQRNGSIYAHYNGTISKFEEVGTYNASEGMRFRSGESNKQSRALYEIVLNSAIARLNNNTFWDASTGEILGNDVICRDYRYLASNSFPDGRPVFKRMNDTRGQATNKTSLVLLDTNFDSAFTSKSEGPSRMAWRSYKPNAHTLWCSTNTTNLGHGYLPLTLGTGLSLMASLAPDALLGTPYRDFSDISKAPESYALSEQRCPNFSISSVNAAGLPVGEFATPGWPGVPINLTALQLLLEDDNAWGEKGDADYNFPGDNAFCNSEVQSEICDRVFWYADSLGWDRSGVLFKPSRNGDYVDPAMCLDRPYNISLSSTFPPRRAKLYASLRYQCSSLSKGVLCDFGVHPPLAVTPEGSYLSKKNMPDLPGVVIFGAPQTATSVEWAVKGMLIALAVSNIVSVVFLVCWPRLRGCAEHDVDVLRPVFRIHKHDG